MSAGALGIAIAAVSPRAHADLLPSADPRAKAAVPVVELLRATPPLGIAAVYLRVTDPVGGDRVYDLGYVARPLTLLVGQAQGRARTLPYRTLPAADLSIERRSLALSLEQVERLIRRLETPSPPYRYDPFVDNGTARVAAALDFAVEGALATQARLPTRGDRLDWIRAELEDQPWLRLAAELMVVPSRDPSLTAWDAAALPSGLERVIDRASIDGRPLVDAVVQTPPRPAPIERPGLRTAGVAGLATANLRSWWALAFAAIALLIGALVAPRAGAVFWGTVSGGLGLVILATSIGGGWTDVVGWTGLVFAPPTHLLLALLALIGPAWRRSGGARVVYAYACLIAAVSAAVASLVGLIAPAPAALAAASVLFNGALILGMRRAPRVRRSPRPAPGAVPRRAISAIEQRSPYVRPGGLRLR